MVLVAKAVVDESAMMIEALHTLVTVVAMHTVLWVQVLAIDADVVKMKLFVDKTLHQAEKVFLKRDIPRVNQCDAVKEDG